MNCHDEQKLTAYPGRHILLGVLVCSIALYFYKLCCIVTNPQDESKYKQVTHAAVLHTETSNERFIMQLYLLGIE